MQHTNRYGRERSYYTSFEGVRPYIERRHREAESDTSRERFEGFMREVPCPACEGSRLKPVSMAVTLGGKNIAEVCRLPINEAADFLRTLELSPRERQIAERVLKEIQERLNFLLDVGLDYLSLDRPSGSLSGGEAQRIRLATQIGAGLVGVLYVLDEPSIGLHQRDNHRLIETLVRLKDLGNTLIVVEHDEDTIRVADWVVDIGPGAGEHGGQVVVSGTVDDLLEHHDSATGMYLSGRKQIPVPEVRRPRTPGRELVVRGAKEHNLRDIDVTFPLGVFVAVTGVSGSGKSTLVNDILYTSLAKQIYNARTVPGRHRRIEGLDHVDKVIHVDQSPIGRTPRSQPGDVHRRLRPRPQAVRVHAGGEGARLPAGPVLVQRQGRPLRGVRRRRHDQDRDELPAGRLRPVRGLPRRPLQPRDARGALQGQDHRRGPRHADRGGRGVLRGHPGDRPAHAHAGRRRPRLRPARPAGADAVRRRGAARQALRRSCRSAPPAAPSTSSTSRPPGLHFEDIRKLLLVLGRLVDQGNTVLVIEHNLDVIKTADWLVDMGPEGGNRGGLVVAEGTPEEVADHPDSYTGQFLKPLLAASPARQPAKKRAARKTTAKTTVKAPTKAPAKKTTAKKATTRRSA